MKAIKKEPQTTPFKKGGNAQEVPNNMRGGEEILSKAMMEKMQKENIEMSFLEARKSGGHIKGFSFDEIKDLLNK